ncbi:MAG: SDR family oxidoreductase [Alphaproteobacteria bacterium]|nr:SDR family oxidoreductase [Alphaproteobacteria bacterium]
MAQGTAVVVGASGVSGRSVIDALAAAGGWNVIGLARRPPNFATSARFISVDLLRPADAKAKLGGLHDVTHIFFCGLAGGFAAENVAPNLALVVNSVGVIEPVARGLERVVLMQGGKYYGAHLGPHKTPAVETDSRALPPNFYYDQQDYLTGLQQGKRWSLVILRPGAIIGFSRGVPLNMLNLLALYGTLCRELGVPFHFPGPRAAFQVLNKYTDAGLLGRASVWAAVEPRCGGEAFNMTNGAGFRWEYVWEGLARSLGAAPGDVRPFPMATLLADKGPIWDALVRRHGLEPTSMDEMVTWSFGDWLFSRTWDYWLDDRKRISFGFTEMIDTEAMFVGLFEQMRAARLLPPL